MGYGFQKTSRGQNILILFVVKQEDYSALFTEPSPPTVPQKSSSLFTNPKLSLFLTIYGSIIRDPHLKKDILLIESVQTFALRIATHSWQENALTLNSHFHLSTLANRCSYFKLLYTYKLLNGYLYCPSRLFVPHPSPTRHFHSKHLIQQFARTCAFYNSFVISSVKLWNKLPNEVVLADCVSSFKNDIRTLYL